jgi:L-threonylcarbamoyladenylate synthase
VLIATPTPHDLAAALAALRADQCVGLPTETVYGLAANGLSPEAVARIFATKQRPSFDPLILHVATGYDLNQIAVVSPTAQALMAAFWPGPLTVLLPKRAVVPDLTTSGLPTVAVRCPDHPVAQAVLAAFGGPLAAPSANRFGRISPTTAAAVVAELGAAVPVVLDGGPCRVGVESTIVDCAGPVVRLLRRGGVLPEQLEAVLGVPVEVVRETPRVEAPGQLDAHYAPSTPLYRVEHALDALPHWDPADAYLFWRRPSRTLPPHARVLSEQGSPVEAAARLFAHLRALDGLGRPRIFVDPVPLVGLGAAIADRLLRASRGTARFEHGGWNLTLRTKES